MNIGTDIQRAVDALRANDVVGIPTETVYGLSANALNDQAVMNIFATKNRPSFNPLILHTNSLEKVEDFVKEFPPQAKQLAKKFWPGPLTLLLPKSDIVPDAVTSGSPLVAVRVPDHLLTLSLLEQLDFPLAAPSANKFGRISPTDAQAVYHQLGDEVAYILDGGDCGVGIESTIIGFENDEPIIYRVGGLSVEMIEAEIGLVSVNAKSHERPKTSGMLKSHYAPETPFHVGDIPSLLKKFEGHKIAVVSFQKEYQEQNNFVLTPTGDLEEAARNLFKFMNKLDALEVDVILAEYVPNEGLGRGVNDRLQRADYKNKS
ncbi:L-threonylcarbamoyladenylate synthase [Cyclobacteriaceae bacterium]|nr:L-threonylcarbamoyladenylate synthase [Cyclobacteriaceae bacterium]